MKPATLEKLQCTACADGVRLVYLDEAGFAASFPVQRLGSPCGLPHCVEPRVYCRRSVLGALDFAANAPTHYVTNSTSSESAGSKPNVIGETSPAGRRKPSTTKLATYPAFTAPNFKSISPGYLAAQIVYRRIDKNACISYLDILLCHYRSRMTIQRDHRAIKRRTRFSLRFEKVRYIRILTGDIEYGHMMI